MAFSQGATFLYKGVLGDLAVTVGVFDGAAVTTGDYNTGLSICYGVVVLPLAAAVLTNQIVMNKANAALPIAKSIAQSGAIAPLVFDSGARGLVIAFGKGY